MGESIEDAEERAAEEFLGELRLTRRLSSKAQVVRLALAASVGAVFLFADPLDLDLGRYLPLAVLLAAAILGLTLLTVLELVGGSSERGGSQGLVAETVGGLPSFLTGWSLIAAEVLLAGAFLRYGGQMAARIVGDSILDLPLALAGLLLVLLTQLFPLDRRRRIRNLALNLVVLGLLAAMGAALLSGSWRPPVAPGGAVDAADFWRTAARMSVLYLGLEAVLASRRQIRSERAPLVSSLALALGAGLVLLAIPLMVLAGLPPEAALLGFASVALGGIPAQASAGLAILAILVSSHAVSTLAARTLYDMSRQGAFTASLRALRRPFLVPPGLILVVGASSAAAVLLADRVRAFDLAVALLLATALGVTAAAIHSRRIEQERRRLIELPLFPVIHAVAIGGILSLFLHLTPLVQILALAWLLLGSAYYFLYARQRQLAAQEGVVYFGAARQIDKKEDRYRIVVPLAPGERGELLLDLAMAVAKQQGGEVLPLQVIVVPDPLGMEEGRRLAKERNTLFRWSTRVASDAGVSVHPITRLARTVPEGIVDTVIEEDCDLLLMPWAIVDGEETGEMGEVLDPVIEQSPCNTAVLAYRPAALREEGEQREEPRGRTAIGDILVPTAGGPHAPLAVGLGLLLAREYGAKVHAVYVAGPNSTPAEIAAGEARIENTLHAMREEVAEALDRADGADPLTGAQVESRIVLSDDVVTGIAEASSDVDLALIGASEESMIDQVLFGNLPRRIAAGCQAPVIMVRRYRGLSRFWVRRLWDSISHAMPTLTSEDQIDLYKRVRRGARPDVDFFVMMGLAAVIATLGLLLDSGAVIIGAMLVAPLFTPILAFSMAIAMGDIRLIRLAIESSLKGIFLAIGLALVIAALAPLPIDPVQLPEIAGRTQPNLLDLAVALAAGAAGAYAVARKDVAAALPGVAIAAALVPPLAVVGIGLAVGRFASAGGAVLLVIANLIAISLAGAITLLLLGFRPADRGERQAHLRMGLVATLMLTIVISIPLGAVLIRAARRSAREQAVTAVLEASLPTGAGYELSDVRIEEGEHTLQVSAWVHHPGGEVELDGPRLLSELEERVGRAVSLRVIPIEVDLFESSDGAQPSP